jgi:phosphonate transport system substrate-binding protein
MRLKISTGICILLLFTLTACGTNNSYPYVSLTKNQSYAAVTNANTPRTVNVAIAPVISPLETRYNYDDFISYLQKKLHRPVHLIETQTYAETNQLLKEGRAEIGLICSLEYVLGAQGWYLYGIAAPEVSGKDLYRSYIIVRKDSGIHSLSGLRGKTFAYSDPNSFSGRLAVQYMLKSQGYSVDHFFSHAYFTYSHDYSIKAVMRGIVDGASVDSLVYAQMQQMQNPELNQLQVIAKSSWVGTPPVVASVKASKSLVNDVEQILWHMDSNPTGKEVLKKMNVERFLAFHKEYYSKIIKMNQDVDKKQ